MKSSTFYKFKKELFPRNLFTEIRYSKKTHCESTAESSSKSGMLLENLCY